jgi:hypothetical protein
MSKLIRTLSVASVLAAVFATSNAYAWSPSTYYRAQPGKAEPEGCRCHLPKVSAAGVHFPKCTHCHHDHG